MRKTLMAVAPAIAFIVPAYADPAPVVHYAPAENLELIDVELIDTAKSYAGNWVTG
jgi:hypothetical protein